MLVYLDIFFYFQTQEPQRTTEQRQISLKSTPVAERGRYSIFRGGASHSPTQLACNHCLANSKIATLQVKPLYIVIFIVQALQSLQLLT